MDLAAELALFNPDPALAAWGGKLLDKSKNDALKIQALTLELAASVFNELTPSGNQ